MVGAAGAFGKIADCVAPVQDPKFNVPGSKGIRGRAKVTKLKAEVEGGDEEEEEQKVCHGREYGPALGFYPFTCL